MAATRSTNGALRSGRRGGGPGTARLARLAGCLAIAAFVGACGLPRSGPYHEELTSAEQPADYGFHVVPVTAAVARASTLDERSGFAAALAEGGAEPVHRLARGDAVAITVWENIDEGLLNPAGVGATSLPATRIDEAGRVFVPYVGLVPAAGRTLAELRETIQARLGQQTLNPQVDILPVEARGRMVSVQGVVRAPGLYPIEPATTRLLAMMARAGGVGLDPEVVRVKLRRGDIQGEVWLSDLYDAPRLDVHLRAGDALIAERDRRIFTALGAVGGPSTVQFPSRDLSVVRALGTVGGLSDSSADPTGVFLFRVETAEVAARLFPGRRFTEPQRVAYVFDLTEPAGLFLARDFMMRDGDTIFATTAPFVRWMKVLQAVAPLVTFSGAVRSVGGF